MNLYEYIFGSPLNGFSHPGQQAQYQNSQYQNAQHAHMNQYNEYIRQQYSPQMI